MSAAVNLRRRCLESGCHEVAIGAGRSLSADELREQVVTLAGALAGREQTVWGIWYGDAADFLVGFLALALAGKRIVMPQNLQLGNQAALTQQFDALLTDQPNPSLSIPQCTPDALREAAPDPWEPDADSSVELTLYTSGSTGEPQAVHKTLALLEAELAVLESCFGQALGKAPVVATVSHQHIYGLLHHVLWPFWRRAPFERSRHHYPEVLAATLKRLNNAVLISSPTHLSRLPAAAGFDVERGLLVDIISSGGPLARQDALTLADRLGCAPLEVLGSTETGGVATRRRTRTTDEWLALPGVTLTLTEQGCLAVQAAHMGMPAPFEMGDRARLLAADRFELLGRRDRVVKVEGKRLSLTEMESRLVAHEAVKDARVVLTRGRREAVAAVVCLNTDGRGELEQGGKLNLNRALRHHLATYFESPLLPRRWRYVDTLPCNPQGKVTMAALESLLKRTTD